MTDDGLWTDLHRRLADPRLGDTIAAAAARRAQAALDTARREVEAVNRDTTRTNEWKTEQRRRIVAQRRAEAEAAGLDARAAVERHLHRLEERTAWPASNTSEEARQAALGNARADLAQLLSGVPAGRRAERAAFAARNGSAAMKELILSERYLERVVWPSTPDAQVDAASWSGLRDGLLTELHPAGEAVRSDLEALKYARQVAAQVGPVIAVAVDLTTGSLT